MTYCIENSEYDRETRLQSRLSMTDGTEDLFELLGFRKDLAIEEELGINFKDVETRKANTSAPLLRGDGSEEEKRSQRSNSGAQQLLPNG